MGIVVFSETDFRAAYPEFNSVPGATLTAYFARATLYLNNTTCSIVQDMTVRAQLLYMLTAHITALLSGVNGAAPTGAVGRVSQATQGSVSATLDMGPTTNNQAWYLQTQYGAMYWQATVNFRNFRYVPGYSRPAPRVAVIQGFPVIDGM